MAGRDGDLAVEVIGGGDADRIQVLLLEHLAKVGIDGEAIMLSTKFFRPLGVRLGDGGKFGCAGVTELGERVQVHLAELPRPHDGYSNGHLFLLLLTP